MAFIIESIISAIVLAPFYSLKLETSFIHNIFILFIVSMLWKCIIEFWLVIIMAIGITYKNRISLKDIVISRGFPAIGSFVLLVGAAIDGANGFNIMVILPILYFVPIYLTYIILKQSSNKLILWTEG